MEGEPRPGVGPEQTDINIEQMTLFDSNHFVTREGCDAYGTTPQDPLGFRRDDLRASEHYVVRGNRLDGQCTRHDPRHAP
jgi:hypothetical protein